MLAPCRFLTRGAGASAAPLDRPPGPHGTPSHGFSFKSRKTARRPPDAVLFWALCDVGDARDVRTARGRWIPLPDDYTGDVGRTGSSRRKCSHHTMSNSWIRDRVGSISERASHASVFSSRVRSVQIHSRA